MPSICIDEHASPLPASYSLSPPSVPALLIVLGGLGIVGGAALPRMYEFAGLIALRG